MAQRIGTYELSITPYEDCCQLFVPRGPSTASSLDEVHRAERGLDVASLVAGALASCEIEQLAFPVVLSHAL